MPKNNGARGSHVKNPNNTNSKMINTHHTLKHHPQKKDNILNNNLFLQRNKLYPNKIKPIKHHKTQNRPLIKQQ